MSYTINQTFIVEPIDDASISGYTGFTDTYSTGATFNNNQLTITNNDGNFFSTVIDSLSGLTVSGDINVGDLSATTLSAGSLSADSINIDVLNGNSIGVNSVSANTLNVDSISANTLSVDSINANRLNLSGAISLNIVSKNTDYTATTEDVTIVMSGSSLTLTLPLASISFGIIYSILNLFSGPLNISSYHDFTNTAQITLGGNLGIRVQSNGLNWQQIA